MPNPAKGHPWRRFSRWSKAVPTMRGDRMFPSKGEARLFDRLTLEAKADGATLLVHVSFPLLSLAPDEKGNAARFNVDFVMVYPDNSIRALDWKGRRSRDWERGKRAFEAWYGIEVEEVTR